MNCIFCKKDASGLKSVEHIIPESLGNEKFILEKGMVCDKCNNYIAVKIEQPLLEHPYFKQYRHELSIGNKRGKIPDNEGFLLDDNNSTVTFKKHKSGARAAVVEDGVTENLRLKKRKQIAAITLTYPPPFADKNLSRFLGKTSLEALVWDNTNQEGQENMAVRPYFDGIRKYVRQAAKEEYWPYTVRRLYAADHMFKNEKGNFKITSGWAFISPPDGEVFFQFLFLGTEFTIDMLNPSNAVFENWLKKNNYDSPVYNGMVNAITNGMV